MVLSSKSDLIDVLNRPDSSVREIYDYLIDHMHSEECFVSGLDRRPRMFEAYNTVIEFSRVMPSLTGFDKPLLARIVTSLRETDFTPLAPILAAFIEASAKAL